MKTETMIATLFTVGIIGLILAVFLSEHYEFKAQESKRALIYYMASKETPCEQMIEIIKEEL